MTSFTPLVVDLASWIIQDGNYGEFRRGQEVGLALEFHPQGDGQLTDDDGAALSATLGEDDRYDVVARVVYCKDGVWALDCGEFCAYQDRSAPDDAQVGQLWRGSLTLAVDAFTYFERLAADPQMPPLSYQWLVESVAVKAKPAPLVSALHHQPEGDCGTHERREIECTNAWSDEGGHGHYALRLRRLSEPRVDYRPL